VGARTSFGSPLRGDPVKRLKGPRVIYHDRPHHVVHKPRHVYTYHDRYDRVCHRIIWPRYCFPIRYHWGGRVAYRWYYPYYHRKYVFVSLGGYWPLHYTYTRYYWYGAHPYVWHGYYPIPRQVVAPQHNYYTYNYYTGEGDSGEEVVYADHNTFADVRERLEAQKAQPDAPTLADTRFEEGVKSFEAGKFGVAAEKFASAMELAPDDMILPFAYAQALFADAQFSAAAAALRTALDTVDVEKEGVFYPRGLYVDDDVLFDQVERLLDTLERYGYDADLQLLLGYHLLGLGETAYARAPLEQAAQDLQNAEAAAKLLTLLDKMEADAAASAAEAEIDEAVPETAPTTKPQPRKTSPELLERARAASKMQAAENESMDVPAKPKTEASDSDAKRAVPPEPDDSGIGPSTPDTRSGGSDAKPSTADPPQGGTPERNGSEPQIGADATEHPHTQPARKEDDDAVPAA
jgi:hypothetical protein